MSDTTAPADYTREPFDSNVTRIYRNATDRFMIVADEPDDGEWASAIVWSLPIAYDGYDGFCTYGCGADPWEYFSEVEPDYDTTEAALVAALALLPVVSV